MGGLSGIAAGLIGSAQGEPSIDLSQLLSTIQNAGQYQQSIINALPPQIQQNLAKYAASLKGAGSAFQGNVNQQLQDYYSKISGLYGPNSEAANAANVANKQNIYSTVPGTADAVRNALAATGGLNRGNAATALASPYINAARQYSQATAGVTAQQTAAAQQAKQQALNVINSMEAGVFQQLFGMSKEQATTILNSSNLALQNQLTQLINQSQNQENLTLGVQGIGAQQGYQNALQQYGNQNAIYTGLAGLGINGLSNFMAPGAGGINAGLPAGLDVGSPSYLENAALIAAETGQ